MLFNENNNTYPPSKYIKEFLDKRNWSQTDLAIVLGWVSSDVSSLMRRKKKFTSEVAQQLADAFDTTAEFWLDIEGKYKTLVEDRVELLQTQPNTQIRKRSKLFNDFPLKDMQKRGWISSVEDANKIESELKHLFNTDNLESDFDFQISYKRTDKYPKLNNAEKIWVARAKRLAEILPVPEFRSERLEHLRRELRRKAAKSKAAPEIAGILFDYGIRYVVVEPLPSARIDGAAFWLDEKSPVVAMSIRYDNIGSFYFTLMHEIAHIYYKDAFSLDTELQEKEPIYDFEKRANEYAAENLIPQAELESFISRTAPFYSKESINKFANLLKIHPGIIVGQLQHRNEIGYNAHTQMRVKVREMAIATAFTDGWGQPIPQID